MTIDRILLSEALRYPDRIVGRVIVQDIPCEPSALNPSLQNRLLPREAKTIGQPILRDQDGRSLFRSGRGDRYYMTIEIGSKLVHVYFAPSLLKGPESISVDLTPQEPAPPLPINWEDPWEDGRP